MLTAEQVRLFHHNGFLILPTRLPEETVAALQTVIREHLREGIEPVVRNRDGEVVRLSEIVTVHPLGCG